MSSRESDIKARKVVHISTVHPATDARIFYREAVMLRELGRDVAVYGRCDTDAVVDGIQIRAIGSPESRVRRILTSWLRGLKVVRKERADIYHFHDPELIPTVILAGALLGKRVVYDAHEDVSLIMRKDWLPVILRSIVAWGLSVVDWLCAKVADGIVTPTRLLHEKYQRLGCRTITLINYPSPAFLGDRDAGWLPLEQRQNRVVHLGTLSMRRLEIVFQTAAGFLEQCEDWSFELIGLHPPMLKWVTSHIPSHLQDRLIAQGMVPHREIAARLCAAKVAINYHTLDYRQIQVAIPVKVFEYLACGLSVVTTRVPLLVELVGDCPAVTLADEDTGAYLRALVNLSMGGELSGRCTVAREFSDRRFNCRVEAEKLVAMYEDIMRE